MTALCSPYMQCTNPPQRSTAQHHQVLAHVRADPRVLVHMAEQAPAVLPAVAAAGGAGSVPGVMVQRHPYGPPGRCVLHADVDAFFCQVRFGCYSNSTASTATVPLDSSAFLLVIAPAYWVHMMLVRGRPLHSCLINSCATQNCAARSHTPHWVLPADGSHRNHMLTPHARVCVPTVPTTPCGA